VPTPRQNTPAAWPSAGSTPTVEGVPRPLRIQLAGAIYHVAARGVDHLAIYRDPYDRVLFERLLTTAIKRFDWRLHAYCQMTTHYHLVVETTEPNLARGMQWLNGVYGQSFNQRHGRSGHLFQGRYAAELIESEEHYAEACRYVLQNPVAAGMVKRAEDWLWSGVAPGERSAIRDMTGV
jgi:REP element-mobilizing transposase RayT